MYGSTIFHISGRPDVPFKGQADGTGSAAGRHLRLPTFLFISKFERPKWDALVRVAILAYYVNLMRTSAQPPKANEME